MRKVLNILFHSDAGLKAKLKVFLSQAGRQRAFTILGWKRPRKVKNIDARDSILHHRICHLVIWGTKIAGCMEMFHQYLVSNYLRSGRHDLTENASVHKRVRISLPDMFSCQKLVVSESTSYSFLLSSSTCINSHLQCISKTQYEELIDENRPNHTKLPPDEIIKLSTDKIDASIKTRATERQWQKTITLSYIVEGGPFRSMLSRAIIGCDTEGHK
jgi:hypothetical protein